MADKIAQGLSDGGVSVKLFDINKSDRTEIIKEMLDAKGFVVGSSTHDNGMLSMIAAFLHFVKGLKPIGRLVCAFGSFGWSGEAVKEIEEGVKNKGIEVAQPGLLIKYTPDANELKQCYAFGKQFASTIQTKE